MHNIIITADLATTVAIIVIIIVLAIVQYLAQP